MSILISNLIIKLCKFKAVFKSDYHYYIQVDQDDLRTSDDMAIKRKLRNISVTILAIFTLKGKYNYVKKNNINIKWTLYKTNCLEINEFTTSFNYHNVPLKY